MLDAARRRDREQAEYRASCSCRRLSDGTDAEWRADARGVRHRRPGGRGGGARRTGRGARASSRRWCAPRPPTCSTIAGPRRGAGGGSGAGGAAGWTAPSSVRRCPSSRPRARAVVARSGRRGPPKPPSPRQHRPGAGTGSPRTAATSMPAPVTSASTDAPGPISGAVRRGDPGADCRTLCTTREPECDRAVLTTGATFRTYGALTPGGGQASNISSPTRADAYAGRGAAGRSVDRPVDGGVRCGPNRVCLRSLSGGITMALGGRAVDGTETGWGRPAEPAPRWRALLDRALLGSRTGEQPTVT